MKFELTREQFEKLLLGLGIAAGACKRDGNIEMFWDLIELANVINKDNPNFTPYEIPERTSFI